MCQPNCRFSSFFFFYLNVNCRGLFLFFVRSESSLPLNPSKKKSVAPCKVIGQIAEGVDFKVAFEEVTGTHIQLFWRKSEVIKIGERAHGTMHSHSSSIKNTCSIYKDEEGGSGLPESMSHN